MKNDNLRHEIFGDVLSTHLGLATSDMRNRKTEEVQFTKGFFLGRHEVSHKFYVYVYADGSKTCGKFPHKHLHAYFV